LRQTGHEISVMTSEQLSEYQQLRATISARGTTRVWVFLLGLLGWAALTVAAAALALAPVLMLVPLAALAAAFEAIFALHVGIERIGRYLQVFHDDCWEQTSMAFGPPLAGTGSDPLFAALFSIATALNFIPVVAMGAVPVELLIIGAAHLVVLGRIVTARRVLRGQRPADLARFQELKNPINRRNLQ
jgi:hypothetical protein